MPAGRARKIREGRMVIHRALLMFTECVYRHFRSRRGSGQGGNAPLLFRLSPAGHALSVPDRGSCGPDGPVEVARPGKEEKD
jgi:hypothetical protein